MLAPVQPSKIVAIGVKQTTLTALAIRQNGRAALHRSIDGRHELRSLCAENIKRACLDQRLDGCSPARTEVGGRVTGSCARRLLVGCQLARLLFDTGSDLLAANEARGGL